MTALALYNQDQQDDAAFVENFVARAQVLRLVVNGLRHIAAGGETEHQILIGMRGMGKTTLLRRVALEIGSDDRLAAVFVPLRFREEQYNVISLDTFWRNCGEALAEWCEENGHAGMAARLDRAVETPDWRDADRAVAGLLAFCAELGRRPCLLVDNLDLILDNLAKDGWALRNVLQREDGPVIVGAATQFLRQAANRDAAFYEFFHPILLEPLTQAELMHCMSALADRRGTAGRPVKDVLAKTPERILTLYTLTGGNPRVLALIYRLLEQAESETILDDLQALLDDVTPFYKARVEEFQAAQQRAVIDAIALNWDPITSGALSEATGIPVTTISSQLNRLRQTGFIEQVETSGSYAGYQLSERFLNIWYLMRHGTRRAKQRLRWLTIFLTRLFSEEELSRMAARAEAGFLHADFRLSVQEAYGEIRAGRLSIEQTVPSDSDGVVDALRAPAGEDAAVAAAAEMNERALALWKAGELEEAAALWDALAQRFDDAETSALQTYVATAWISKGITLGQLGRPEEEIAAYDVVIARLATSDLPPLQELVATAWVNKGITLGQLGRPEEAIAAYDDVIARLATSDLPPLQEPVARAWVNKGITLGQLGRPEEEIAAYDAVIARLATSDLPPLQEQVAKAWVSKGITLGELGRPEEEIAAYDEVIARLATSDLPPLQEQVAKAWVNKGITLGQLGRPEEEIAAYDEVITRFGPKEGLALEQAAAWFHKGRVLDQLARFEAAIAAFDELTARFSGSEEDIIRSLTARGLSAKGRLLITQWGRYDEAEACYRRALAIRSDPTDSANLVWAMIAQGRWDDAQTVRDTVADVPPEGLALIDAGIELVRDNLGNAFVHLGAALDRDMQEDASPSFETLLWLLRIGTDRGHGERLITWFADNGTSERYAPVYAALLAYVRGERFLRDLNPETRGVAERLYEKIAVPRRRRQADA